MDTALEVMRYAIAGVFMIVGLSAMAQWVRTRDSKHAHLAWATGLMGAATLMSVILLYLFPFPNAERLFAPIGLVMVATGTLFLSLYAYLFFLADFIRYPAWIRTLAGAGLVVSLVLTFSLRAPAGIIGGKVVPLEPHLLGIEDYTRFWYWAQIVVFGALAVTFVAYLFRVTGIARFRMAMVAGATAILCVCGGGIPLWSMAEKTGDRLWIVLDSFVALAALMLYLGFTTPKALADRIGHGRPHLRVHEPAA